MNDLIQDPDFVRATRIDDQLQQALSDPAGGGTVTSVNGLNGSVGFDQTGGSSGFSFANSAPNVLLVSPLTTKGDLYTRSSSAGIRLAVGNEGEGLFVDPSTGSGLIWRPTEFIVPVTLNLNTNTKQTLYTVPAGKSAIVTDVIFHGSSVDLSGGATAAVSFGFNAGANDWANPAYNPAGLTLATQFVVVNQFAVGGGGGGPSIIGTAGQIFGAITDVAFGSAATVTIDVHIRLF